MNRLIAQLGHLGWVLLLAGASGIAAAATANPPAASPSEPRRLNVETKAWTGDFDGMLERRMIRVAVP